MLKLTLVINLKKTRVQCNPYAIEQNCEFFKKIAKFTLTRFTNTRSKLNKENSFRETILKKFMAFYVLKNDTYFF